MTPYAQLVLEQFTETNLVGVITMLDSILLFSGNAADTATSLHWIAISHRLFHLINGLCKLDLKATQVFFV
jgi:hypothetical protein